MKPPKTNRKELSKVARAFAVGASIALRGDYASQRDLAQKMGFAHNTLSRLVTRIEKKVHDCTRALWDEVLYDNEPGRGRKVLLTQDQKNRIIALVTSSRDNREKESWQAISDGDFDEILPSMSVSTFENVMYEAGYARRRPGWKPHLTPDQEEERYRWALAHNPDKD